METSEELPDATKHQTSPLVSPVATPPPTVLSDGQDPISLDDLVHGVPFGASLAGPPSNSIVIPSGPLGLSSSVFPNFFVLKGTACWRKSGRFC